MAKIYYNLVKDGLYTIDKVPALWRNAVKEMLEADNR